MIPAKRSKDIFKSPSSCNHEEYEESMSKFLPDFSVTLYIGLGVIFFIVCGIMAWTTRIGFRTMKVEIPKFFTMFSIAFLQLLLGGMTVLGVKAINDDPILCLGTGLGILLLSGLFWIKILLKTSWKQALGVWALAAGIQLVAVPVSAGVLVAGWIMITFLLFPPQL
jgi:hypothetical protein